jgi:hypothetical protein
MFYQEKSGNLDAAHKLFVGVFFARKVLLEKL